MQGHRENNSETIVNCIAKTIFRHLYTIDIILFNKVFVSFVLQRTNNILHINDLTNAIYAYCA